VTADNFYAEHLERMVQGYAEMAQIQVARDFVWDRINELADTDPLLWGQLPELVPARAKEIRNAGISR
jgi:hypothetical protein